MGYGRFKQNFPPRSWKPVLVVNARASRPARKVVRGAELSGIEFLIADIVNRVSSLRNKMSMNLEFSDLVNRL